MCRCHVDASTTSTNRTAQPIRAVFIPEQPTPITARTASQATETTAARETEELASNEQPTPAEVFVPAPRASVRNQRVAASIRHSRVPMTRSRTAANARQIVEEQAVDRRITRQMSRQIQQDQQRTQRE